MKMPAPRIVVTLIGMLFALSAPAAESLWLLLQKGIYAEETEGNLESAITIYEQIALEGATNRSLSAQAQYRLAACYQKQGNKELAVAAFNELSKQFPTETALAQKAREQLIALGQPAAEAVTLRKIAMIDNYWFRGVSPDGRLIAYMGQNGQTLLQEAATGKIWQPFESNWDNQPLGFVFSADSRRIAWAFQGKGLFIAEVDGSNVRQIFKSEGKDHLAEPRAWSVNGKIIAILGEEKAPKSIVSIDPRTGALEKHQVEALAPGAWQGELSSNGKSLVFLERSDLAVIDLETGKRTTLVEGHAIENLGWARDDSELYFTSNRTWAKGLWVVPMKDGQPAGEPRLVKQATDGTWFASVAKDGRMYYIEPKNDANVVVASVNFATGEVTEAPHLITERFAGMQTSPLWSNQGSKLWLAIRGEQNRVASVSLPSGQEREVLLSSYFSGFRNYSVSPDGTFLLIEGGRLNPGRAGIHRFDLSSFKVETLVSQTFDTRLNRPVIAPDGTAFYYFRRVENFAEQDPDKKRRTLVMRRELASDRDEVLCEYSGERVVHNVSVAADGAQLAFLTSNGHSNENRAYAIDVFDRRTRKSTELVRVPPAESGWATRLGWTPDGAHVVYTRRNFAKRGGDEEENTIWSTSVATRRSVKLNLPSSNNHEFDIHPDGRQIAFRTGSRGDRAQLWLMEGTNRTEPAKPQFAAQRKVAVPKPSTALALSEVLDSDNAIYDKLTGLRAAIPSGWELATAMRGGSLFIRFKLHGREAVAPDKWANVGRPDLVIAVNSDQPNLLPESEIEPWLRNWAAKFSLEHRKGERWPGYRNRPESFRMTTTVGGLPALHYEADFKIGGAAAVEIFTLIYGEQGCCCVHLTATADEAAKLRADYEQLVRSIRLPAKPRAVSKLP